MSNVTEGSFTRLVWSILRLPCAAPCTLSYVDIGANKGYAVNEFLQSYQRGWNHSNGEWEQVMLRAKGTLKNSCGECGSCELPLPPSGSSATAATWR